MPVRPVVLLAAAALVGVIAVAAPAAAAPGPGTFTRITTPSGNLIFKFDGTPSSTHNHFPVSGVTSNDVTSVDIDCFFTSSDMTLQVKTLAAAVPVTGGAFSTTAQLTVFTTNCRLRAVPTGTSTNTYLGSYSGPILYSNALAPSLAGPTKYGFTAIGEQGDGVVGVEDAGTCGVALIATIETPSMQVRGVPGNTCGFGLPKGNITTSGTPTASSIRVSGHNAYLPGAIHGFGLSAAQPGLATSFSAASNGDVTVTESATLWRCSVSDSYPATDVSCPSFVSTGVKFVRVTNIFRGAHQVRFRDTFTSTDGQAHGISLQYQAALPTPATGATGYVYPGHTSTFHKAAPDQVVTGLGTRAGTVLARSDMYASSDEPTADTIGLTWSRGPSKVQFSHTSPDLFAMPYSLSVPAAGRAFLGFAVSERVATSGVKSLAATAVGEMVNVPSITSPANGAKITGHTTTVRGKLTAGANGLPTSVVVNGHAAHITRTSTTTATYKVSFSESYAKHTIKVTAKDVAGNTRSRSITVTNKA